MPREMTRAVAPTTTRRRATMCAARVRDTDFSLRHRLGLPAQAPAYYYYTATDDSTYGYDDSAGDDGDDVRPVWRYNFLLRNADLTFSAWVWATFSRAKL